MFFLPAFFLSFLCSAWAKKRAHPACNFIIRVHYENNKFIKHEIFSVSCFDTQ